LPTSDSRKASGYISCHYLVEDYPRIIDLLRNEKPVYVEFDVQLGNMSNIRTSAEPVGEGEQD
jgi:ppGpp synthetase/RelA/SpoT-type nucleotidyltranferase